MILPVKLIVGLLPVFIFLAALYFLDSFRLVKPRTVLIAILTGCGAALVCMFLNRFLLDALAIKTATYSRYLAPIVEESFKAVYLVFLIRLSRVGFLVDAAICGFAIGAGFAFTENLYYLFSIDSTNILVWVVRGFGTAAMHGGTVAIFAIISKGLSERFGDKPIFVFIPGMVVALAVHSFFNHFVLSPVANTITLVLGLPIILTVIFNLSERATRNWLGVGMDADIDLLEMINNGEFSQSPAGRYLESLRSRFSGPVVADMFCMLRLHLELAMRAKGILLMRQSGYEIDPDPEIKARFDELKYLEKSIGKTGKLAIRPFIHTKSRDLWQIYMLKD